MNIETDIWPLRLARWYKKYPGPGKRPVRVIVIHDMEAPEKGETAENVAKYFQTLPESHQASAHVCIDNDSVVQCVRDNDIAYAAPGANSDGIQLELAGYGNQTRGQWLDPYGLDLIDHAANVAAQYCCKFDIPPVHLTNEQLLAGKSGIIGHVQASQVYKKSDHQDPGPNFPWDYFTPLVVTYAWARINVHQAV